MVKPLQWCLLSSVALAACGSPRLVPADPASGDGEATLLRNGPLSILAVGNRWFEEQLSEVSTPLSLTFVNAGDAAVPVSLEGLTLTDERGRRYRALPPDQIVSALFGPQAVPPAGQEPQMQVVPERPGADAPESEPADGQPGAGEDEGAQPHEAKPPAAPATPTAPPPEREQTRAPSGEGALELTLVSGHPIAPVGGGHGTVSPAPTRRYGSGYGYGYGRGRYGFYGRQGWYGGGYGLGYGIGWGYPWWGPWAAYGYAGSWGWWFGPSYVMNLNSPEGPEFDPALFDGFGPTQILSVALRDAELKGHQKMAGLVFFEPAWKARLVTLHFVTEPAGLTKPVRLSARFAVER